MRPKEPVPRSLKLFGAGSLALVGLLAFFQPMSRIIGYLMFVAGVAALTRLLLSDDA